MKNEANLIDDVIDIKDFVPTKYSKYYISRDGRVMSAKTKRIMKQFDNGNGYLYVPLFVDGKKKTVRVNILVAEAFIPKPDVEEGTKLDVAHLDSDRRNNNVSNLAWKTRSENLDTESFREKAQYKIYSKVRCVETGEIFPSIAAAGRAIGKHKYGINLCLLGRQKTCGGYHWERVLEQ